MVARPGLPAQPRLVRRAMALRRIPPLPTFAMFIGMQPVLAGGGFARAASDVAAAVVVIGDLSPGGSVEAARDQVPARWRLEPLRPETPPPIAPEADVDLLARAYLNADFLRCLTEL